MSAPERTAVLFNRHEVRLGELDGVSHECCVIGYGGGVFHRTEERCTLQSGEGLGVVFAPTKTEVRSEP